MATSASTLVLQGKYQLFRKLADAGHIEVYLGATRSPRQAVMVKRVPPSLAKNKPTVGGFLDEARTTARLQHPAIAQVLDVGEDGGTYVAVFEHLFGVDAEKLLEKERKGKLPIPIALRLVVTVLEALEHAHAAVGDDGSPLQLVHRDVSARNVLVGYDGRIKLTGFGLAKHQERSEHTSFGVVRGQLAYVSPEQLRVGELDARTDLWSTGVLLYQLLTGALPFDRQGEFHVLKAIRDEDPKPPSELRAELPAALDAVMAKALAKDREQRFSSAAEMHAALEKIGGLANPDDVAEHVARLFSSALGTHLAEAMAGEASLTTMLALAGGEVLGEPEPEAKPARRERPSAPTEQPASTERTSLANTDSTSLPLPRTPPRAAPVPAPAPIERAQQETAFAASPLDPSTDSARTPLPDPDRRPSDGFRPERPPLPPEHTPEPPVPVVRHMPEAPRASVPRPESTPDPKPEVPERRGSKKRRVRFKLVTERGLNPIVYPLAALVALLLGLAAGRSSGPAEVALEPLPAGGPPLAALDAPIAPLAPRPVAPAPTGPTGPVAPAHINDELQLSAQTEHGTGTLRVDAPRGARVFIDKKQQHGAGSLSVSLTAGVHDLKVVLPSGAVKEESVHVESGKTVHRAIGASGKVVPQQPKSSNWP
ncbi:MAG: protein kinase [Deltaproteobacteria bacterium]|nr:protein kinase [Deltaproteobacteria bacterium]